MTFCVTFHTLADGKTHSIEGFSGEKLTQIAHRGKIVIQQTCAGKASCTDCKILVTKGLATGLAPPTSDEIRATGNVSHITKERLACQAIVVGEVAIEVPDPSKVNIKKRRK
jgi:ferredoxin